ncbi:hypothetical protein BDR04DRAFT_1151822 [Suillus decipiens]|nr:hypothetical protein BDR04DRAFT_1151822 [Suillus decipiens]
MQLHLEQQEKPSALAPSKNATPREHRECTNTIDTPTPTHTKTMQEISEEPSKPAIFDPETPMLPTKPIKNNLPSTMHPPIPQPDFLKPLLAPSKPPKQTTSSPTPAIQITVPSPSNIAPILQTLIPPSTSSHTLPVPSTHYIHMTTPPFMLPMANASKEMPGMPGPGSNKAPSFNGKTSELIEFFKLFEDLASSRALMDEQKCKAIVQYTDTLTKRFWITLFGYESKDYMVFKQNILTKYPHANQGIHYMIRDLE